MASFSMACNVLWRYAQFANNTGVMSAVEPLCHETAQRILDLRVPASGIYSEMDEEGNISERMHPDITGWIFHTYDWHSAGQRYVSRAPASHAARNGANVSYESSLMYWKALDMYIANFGV